MKTIKWAGNATSISTAASATSQTISLRNESVGVCIQVAWTSTTAGTLKAQASNDGVQWDDIDGITVNPAGSAGTDIWVIGSAFFQYVQVVFTRSGGTGLLSGTYNEKSA